ncbi:MAG: hypothetical protein VCA37_16945 [Roseibacillus sp.]
MTLLWPGGALGAGMLIGGLGCPFWFNIVTKPGAVGEPGSLKVNRTIFKLSGGAPLTVSLQAGGEND